MATTIKPLLASPRSLPTTTSSPTGTRKRIVDDGSLKTMIVIAIASVFCILLALIFVVSLAVSSSNAVGEETAAANAADQQHLSGPKTNATDRRNHHPMGEYLSGRLRSAVSAERRQLDRALRRIRHLGESNLPARLRNLRERHAVVGERLVEVRDGVKTVSEILHGHDRSLLAGSSAAARPPMELDEIIEFLDSWIHLLHETLLQHKHSDHVQVWQAYHDLTVATLYPWDQEYLRRMPKRRDDGSIFLSLASYRDENCPNTIHEAYRKAKNPEKLFVGFVQQNCHHNCRSGVMSNQSVYDVPPDESCLDLFCKTDLGASICGNKQVRLLDIDEPESLGPYAARFFASKLWYGENWFMQTDSHMTFAGNWDATSIEMLTAAPSEKPILSHYPPAHTVDLDGAANINAPGARVCGPVFTTGQAEAQMVRLEGAGADHQKLKTPAFAPFTAAGYFVALADFLHEVPFDPFLPWIFMGEEIIMSTRFWTAGYDIFSPTTSVVGHMYGRREKPKFWESVNRAFTFGIHNPLKMMVLDRIKHQLGYPEAARDMIPNKSLLTAVEQYSMGKERPLEEYFRIVGLNPMTKEVTHTAWCEKGFPPPGFEKFNHLYPASPAK